MLHCISTRFSLYTLADRRTYNTRALSTLAIESFFSDLSKFEFSGLGAPKSTDIPKLISHIVHVNTTKHDPKRGFEFTTSTRDNYPCYIMELADDNTEENQLFRNHPFDKYPGLKKKKKNSCLYRSLKLLHEEYGVLGNT